MKKILAACLFVHLLVTHANAQFEDEIRRSAIGVSFFLNDYQTAQKIRSTSLTTVFRNKQWSKLKDMSAGLAVYYFKGLSRHMDFAGSLGGSFARFPLPNKTFTNDKFLLEAEAALNLKMVSEKYWVQPYLIAGVGANMYGPYWGAYTPLGLGLKVNIMDEAHIFITTAYKIPVTTATSAYRFTNSVGIAGAIGKKKEPKIITPPEPPPPAPPADTDGGKVL